MKSQEKVLRIRRNYDLMKLFDSGIKSEEIMALKTGTDA